METYKVKLIDLTPMFCDIKVKAKDKKEALKRAESFCKGESSKGIYDGKVNLEHKCKVDDICFEGNGNPFELIKIVSIEK